MSEKELNGKDRLQMISQSIRTLAMMAQCNVTYCINLPEVEDQYLASNYIPNCEEAEKAASEIAGNIVCIIAGFMGNLLTGGATKAAAEGIADEILARAKALFAERTEGIGEGAGPQ